MPRIFSASYQRYSASEGATGRGGDSASCAELKILIDGRRAFSAIKVITANTINDTLRSRSRCRRTKLITPETFFGFCAFSGSNAQDAPSSEPAGQEYDRRFRLVRQPLSVRCIYNGKPGPTKLLSLRLHSQNR